MKNIAKKIKDIPQGDEPLTAIFYGKAGTGKTTLLGTFPKVLHLDIREEGQKVLKKVKGIKSASIEDWDDLVEMYWYLKKERHGFKTVGIDTAGQAQMLAVESVMKKHKKKGKPGDWGTMTQKMWGEVATMCKELFLDFRDLKKIGINVVFIAHDRVFKAKDEEDEDDDTISRIAPHMGPALSPSIVSTLNAAVDLVGENFIGEELKVFKDKKTGKKSKKKITEYYLRIGPNSSYITKVRRPKTLEKLPDAICNPDYDKLIELMEGN